MFTFSPSPLQTSRYANIMSSPTLQPANKPSFTTASSPVPFSTTYTYNDENMSPCPSTTAATNTVTPSTATSFFSPSSISFGGPPNPIIHTPTPITTASIGTNIITDTPSPAFQEQPFFSFSNPLPKPPSSYFEARHRSSSPQFQLHSTTALLRQRRKTAFLDRIRSRRDEDRFHGKDEAVLRMDFWKQRREWEERLKLDIGEEGHVEGWLSDDDEPGNDMQELRGGEDAPTGEEQEPSPTEEKEIEELLSYMLAPPPPAPPVTPVTPMSPEPLAGGDVGVAVNQMVGGETDEMDGDEEYDRLFAEMSMDDFEPMVQQSQDAPRWEGIENEAAERSETDIL